MFHAEATFRKNKSLRSLKAIREGIAAKDTRGKEVPGGKQELLELRSVGGYWNQPCR